MLACDRWAGFRSLLLPGTSAAQVPSALTCGWPVERAVQRQLVPVRREQLGNVHTVEQLCEVPAQWPGTGTTSLGAAVMGCSRQASNTSSAAAVHDLQRRPVAGSMQMLAGNELHSTKPYWLGMTRAVLSVCHALAAHAITQEVCACTSRLPLQEPLHTLTGQDAQANKVTYTCRVLGLCKQHRSLKRDMRHGHHWRQHLALNARAKHGCKTLQAMHCYCVHVPV